jgi:hypothetical protein
MLTLCRGLTGVFIKSPSSLSMRSCDNRLVAIFLAMFVLFAQHGASLHALSHATQDIADSSKSMLDKKSPSGHENCEQCLSFAAAGAGLVGSQSLALLGFEHVASTLQSGSPLPRRTTTAYRSRAPPHILV